MKSTTHATISATAPAVVEDVASVISAHLGDHSKNCAPIPVRNLQTHCYDQGVSEDLVRPRQDEPSCREVIIITFPDSICLNVAVSPTGLKSRPLGCNRRRQE